jgi:hypothetical protein
MLDFFKQQSCRDIVSLQTELSNMASIRKDLEVKEEETRYLKSQVQLRETQFGGCRQQIQICEQKQTELGELLNERNTRIESLEKREKQLVNDGQNILENFTVVTDQLHAERIKRIH